MSINDCYRLLHDHNYGKGSYDQETNSMYNNFVNSTMSYGYSNSTSRSPTSPNLSSGYTPYNSNGNFGSGFIFLK